MTREQADIVNLQSQVERLERQVATMKTELHSLRDAALTAERFREILFQMAQSL